MKKLLLITTLLMTSSIRSETLVCGPTSEVKKKNIKIYHLPLRGEEIGYIEYPNQDNRKTEFLVYRIEQIGKKRSFISIFEVILKDTEMKRFVVDWKAITLQGLDRDYTLPLPCRFKT